MGRRSYFGLGLVHHSVSHASSDEAVSAVLLDDTQQGLGRNRAPPGVSRCYIQD